MGLRRRAGNGGREGRRAEETVGGTGRLGQSTINDTGHHQTSPRWSPTHPNVQTKGLPGPQPVNPKPLSSAPLSSRPERVGFEHRRGKGQPSVLHKMRNQRKVSVLFAFDVVFVLVETDTYGVPRFPHILEIACEATDEVHTIFGVNVRVPVSGKDISIIFVVGPRNEIIKIGASVNFRLHQGP